MTAPHVPYGGHDHEERVFDELVADMRRRHPPGVRCRRLLRYPVAPRIPVTGASAVPVGRPIEVEVRDAQCEREWGHAGDCVARREDGHTIRGKGTGGRWDR